MRQTSVSVDRRSCYSTRGGEDSDRHVRQYVSNDSFNRAIDIPEKHHVCIVAGLPGGTSLAEPTAATRTDCEWLCPATSAACLRCRGTRPRVVPV
jgi:hypothetical protein